jgi:hypothetical protein
MSELSRNYQKNYMLKPEVVAQFEKFAETWRIMRDQIALPMRRQAEAIAAALNTIAAPLNLVIEAQRAVAKTFNQSFLAIQRTLAKWLDDPEVILAMALIKPEDRRRLTTAISKLLGKLDNGNAIIAGEPPKLIILGHSLNYGEILAIEDVFPGQRPDDIDGAIARIIRDIKGHINYTFQNEIKRQGMNSRYREMSLSELPELGRDGFEDQVIDRRQEDELLSNLALAATSSGWRKDRIDSMLLVAKYALKNGTLRDASKFLPIHRDTIFERKKDLRFLLSRMRQS